MGRFDLDSDPAAGHERSRHPGPNRPYRGDHVVQDVVHRGFMERPVIPVREQVYLEGLAFQAELVRDVSDSDVAEVWLSRDGAQGREFGTFELNGVFPVGVCVGKCFQRGDVGLVRVGLTAPFEQSELVLLCRGTCFRDLLHWSLSLRRR